MKLKIAHRLTVTLILSLTITHTFGQDNVLKGTSNQHYIDAIRLLQREMKISDSINELRLDLKEKEMRRQFDTEKKEQLLASLKIKNKSESVIVILVALTTCMAIGIFALVISVQRMSIKRNAILTDIEKERLRAEIELKKLNEKNIYVDLEFRARELTSFTLNLIQKNELIDTIKKEIAEIRKKADSGLKLKLTKLTTKINLSIQAAKNWEYFKMYFEKIHSGFFTTLSARYPEFKRNDLKLCALVKLGLDTNQIATIMEISSESVKVARHRLRKKLGMKPKQTYQDFFADIHPESAVNPDLSDLPFLIKDVQEVDDDF